MKTKPIPTDNILALALEKELRITSIVVDAMSQVPINIDIQPRNCAISFDEVNSIEDFFTILLSLPRLLFTK